MPLRSNFAPTFLWAIFDLTVFFFTYIFTKGQVLFSFQSITLYLSFHMGPLREFSSFCAKLFYGLFSLMLHPFDFHFSASPTLPSWNAITGYLSSSPTPLFFFEASLPPLRVALTHFALSWYERALRLPISFPISYSARPRVKPRLSRYSRRVFASTHLLMLSLTCPREALSLLFSPWNYPSCYVDLTPFTPCSRSDPPVSRQSARNPFYPFYNLSHFTIL